MIPPLQVFRELCDTAQGAPRRRPITVIEIVAFGALAVLVGFLLVHYDEPIRHVFRRLSRGGRFGVMVAMLPVVLVVAAVGAAYARWRERGTEPFPFPIVLDLHRWRIYRRDGDSALFLTDGRGLMCLFVRPTDETVEQVLDALDPDNLLEVDDEQSDAITFELPGNRVARGLLKRFADPHAYAFVIGHHQYLLDDLSGVLGRARCRRAGERPQKWRPLEAPVVAEARIVR